MHAMILAAGRGERMRPLTDHCPKPLLPAGGKPLIGWHLERLAAAGFTRVVINHAHLGARLEAALGNGAQWGLEIAWSPETSALETAGGIALALGLLGDAPFLVVNGDLWTDFDLARAPALAKRINDNDLDACCVLVPNPGHHPEGDFALDHGLLRNEGAPRWTFSGIGVYHPRLFAGITRGARAPLGPLLRDAAQAGRAGGEVHLGRWMDIGTPQRLAELDNWLRNPG
jgi:MurNAc alpha-1-phosphate uridylyltransferase